MKLLHNARIYTLHPKQPLASAVLIDRERILKVGSDQELLGEVGRQVELFDLQRCTILPGLIDAHLHLRQYALNLQKVNCETQTLEECLHRVAARARQTSQGSWVVGHGWNQNEWAGGFGTAAQLDAIVPNHPVYLTAKSLHAAWVNSLALQKAGIDPDTPDPLGGKIQRDAQGQPTGILFEKAMELVQSVIPQPSDQQMAEAIREAIPSLWKMGLTGIHDFDQPQCFRALQELHQTGELHLRVVKHFYLEYLQPLVDIGLRTGFGDNWLRIGGIKAFTDGALGPRTAAMLEPYESEPNNRGMLLMTAEEIFEHGRLATEHGLAMVVHAIGDRANREALDGLARLRAFESEHQIPPLRHRIEHVQLLHPTDANRLAEHNLIASMQPIHATSDMMMSDRYWGGRAALAYAWKTQLEAGAVLAFGSDAPVESPNPFWGLHAATTRRRPDGTPGPDGWHPEQRLSLKAALAAYTQGPAFAANMEDRLGRLAVDYLADLILLPEDPFNLDADRLRELQPLATMVGGEWVWVSPPAPWNK
jgi:hypothetical protein